VSRWLVTGAGGMLGQDLLHVLADNDVTGLTRADLDITDARAVIDAVAGHDIVVNTAAWTDVDAAESHEDAATRVNAHGAGNVAVACARHGARLVQLSTDYVFAGDASSPYPEDAPTAPRSAYGRGKAAGERAVLAALPDSTYVVRTAWLYGQHGTNFVATMLRLERERDVLDVVDDQHGQPTWSRHLAQRIRTLAESSAPPGIYHATSSGQTTWHGLAQAVFAAVGADPARVRPTSTDRFPRPAPRPAYSVLGQDRWAAVGPNPMPHWREALAQALPQLRSSS
jgi:dTDP-4-dehydrorhamnose reductase